MDVLAYIGRWREGSRSVSSEEKSDWKYGTCCQVKFEKRELQAAVYETYEYA